MRTEIPLKKKERFERSYLLQKLMKLKERKKMKKMKDLKRKKKMKEWKKKKKKRTSSFISSQSFSSSSRDISVAGVFEKERGGERGSCFGEGRFS